MAVTERFEATLVNHRHSKAYAGMLESTAEGFVVNFAYGSIGALQRPGTKTPKPVDETTARRIYTKLKQEKTGGKPCECCGGVYTVTKSSEEAPAPAAPGAQTVKVDPKDSKKAKHSAFTPSLLEPIAESQAAAYILNSRYGAQRKYDGVRMGVSRREGTAVCFNRLGQLIPVPPELLLALSALDDCFLDGEWLGGRFVAWDLLERDGADLRGLPMLSRYNALLALLSSTMLPTIVIAKLARTEAEKMELVRVEHEHRGEGVVFKRLDERYMPGRQGIDVKFKFWASCTVRVCAKEKQDGHNSFAVEALRRGCRHEPGDGCDELCEDFWVPVGRVTCKGPIPEVGTYREVKYLYLGVGERLYQPEDLGARTDVTDADCSFNQLKRKQDTERLALA